MNHNYIKTIFLDMDGVLVDFIGNAIKLHNLEKNEHEIKLNDKIDFSKFINKQQFKKPMTIQWWATLSKTPYFSLIINVMKDLFKQKKICILSSPLDERSAAGKIIWIKRELPKVPYILTKYKHFCANSNVILIDDYIENCKKFSNNGGNIIPFSKQIIGTKTNVEIEQYLINSINNINLKIKNIK